MNIELKKAIDIKPGDVLMASRGTGFVQAETVTEVVMVDGIETRFAEITTGPGWKHLVGEHTTLPVIVE